MDVSSKKCKRKSKRSSGNRVKRKAKVDYISDLPEHVLHRILSYMHRKDAARTSILSKKWREIWNSYHVFDLDISRYSKLPKWSRESYRNLIDRLLTKGEEQLPSIHKFKLCFGRDSGLEYSEIFNLVIAVVERNVRELEVQFKGELYACLPRCVLCGSTITTLILKCCILPRFSINLPRLQNLSLKKMSIRPVLFENLITGCPLIEDLRLIQCDGFKSLLIGPLERLRRVDVHKCHLLDNIDIQAQGLESFWYYNDKKRLCDINLSACGSLKELILEYRGMTNKMFHDRSMDFPKLEKLVLSRCNGLKNIQVSGDKLRRLVIRRCRNLIVARINTPNLSSFEYCGRKMSFSFLTRPILREALLSFEMSSETANNSKVGGVDASRLNSFLDNIDRDKGLKFMSVNELGVVIYEDVRAMLLPLRHMSKPHIIEISTHYQDLIDAALKTSFLPTISIMSHCDSYFPEVIHQELNKEKVKPGCCGCFVYKCWRHYLENVSVENWIFKPKELSDASTSFEWQKTTLTLDWKTDSQGLKARKAC